MYLYISSELVKPVLDSTKTNGGVQSKEKHKSSKFTDIVSFALKMGVTSVFVVYFRS